MLSFSIVINTLNRASLLQKTLESFRWIKYAGDFEVIVVNGPSTDNSDEVIAAWQPMIRAGNCDVANLSVSRNIAICMAQGDIVAFIDDDAIPEPEWLAQLAEAYKDPGVGAVGGLVYNHTGYDFQYQYCLVDRLGNADLSLPGPTPHLSFPKSYRFPHLLGCNSSFRRSALLEVGGFDEEYEYFLDETDVCLRIVDAGYVISQLPNAYVHHKYAPSNIRGENRVPKYRYPVIKNKIYFMLKHGREFHPIDYVIGEQQTFIQNQRKEIDWAIGEGLLSAGDLEIFNKDVERAVETGLRRGLEGVAPDAMITGAKIERHKSEFLPFEPISKVGGRSIVIVSRDYPPENVGGIATFSKDLAEALGARGHIVHLITLSADLNRVDFENGVWVHRMVLKQIPMPGSVLQRHVPAHIWNWSATALEECRRIATHRDIEVVEAPIWDCEGIAFLLDGGWPLVTSLQTTMHFWLDTHANFREDKNWMASFGAPMLRLEKEVMTASDAVRAISAAIKRDIETAYDFQFDNCAVQVAPLGLSQRDEVVAEPVREGVEILFVGRLEARKGIDILLKVIPGLLQRYGDVRVKIVGDNSLSDENGETYMERFLAEHLGADWLSRVCFTGKVSEEALQHAYATCDIFVAPSRFESFGLVFLEAMRVGKPVIGSLAGGMPEVVSDGENGLLVPPGDAVALANALTWMVEHPKERARMGHAGRKIFDRDFTSAKMAERSLALYDLAVERHWARSR